MNTEQKKSFFNNYYYFCMLKPCLDQDEMQNFSVQWFQAAGPQKPEQRVDSGNKISALTAPLGLDENGLELD